MKKWKIGFFILLVISCVIIFFQQFRISDMKWENEKLGSIMIRADKDLALVAKSLLANKKKDYILEHLKKTQQDLNVVEYDLGVVKMSGIDLNFDKDGNLTSISLQIY